MADIDDIASKAVENLPDELWEAAREAVGDKLSDYMRGEAADAMDEMLDGLLEAVDGEDAGGSDYAEGEIDTEDEENVWTAVEVSGLLADAWKAGFDHARTTLAEAIDTAKYRG